MNNKTDWEKLGQVGKNASLKENVANESETRAKHLKAVPAAYFDDHKELKKAGKTSLDFTSYILEALREKLETDKAK